MTALQVSHVSWQREVMGLHSPSVCLLLWAFGVDVAQRWGVSPSSDCCRLKAPQNCDDIRASGPVTRRCFGSAWGVATGACRWFSTFSHTAAWLSCAAFWRGWLCAVEEHQLCLELWNLPKLRRLLCQRGKTSLRFIGECSSGAACFFLP